jgi:hypothetical protein
MSSVNLRFDSVKGCTIVTHKLADSSVADMMETLGLFMILQSHHPAYVIESIGSRTIRVNVPGNWVFLSDVSSECTDAMRSNIGLIFRFALMLVNHVAILSKRHIFHGNIRPETIIVNLDRENRILDLGLVNLSNSTSSSSAADVSNAGRCIAWLVARCLLGRFVAADVMNQFETFDTVGIARHAMRTRSFGTSTQKNIVRLVERIACIRVDRSQRHHHQPCTSQHTFDKLTHNQPLVVHIMEAIKLTNPSHFTVEFVRVIVQMLVPGVLMLGSGDIRIKEIADFMLCIADPLVRKCDGTILRETHGTFSAIKGETLVEVARESRAFLATVQSSDQLLAVLSRICDTPTFMNFSTVACKLWN